MFRKTFYRMVIGLFAVGGAFRSAAAEESPSAARWLPGDTVAVLEVIQPQEVWNSLLDAKMTEIVAAHPLFEKATAEPKFRRFRAVVAFLERQLATDWRSALRKLTGGGVTTAITSQGVVIVMIDAEDAGLLAKLYRMVLGFAESNAQKEGDPGRLTSAAYRGAAYWEVRDGSVYAMIGGRFIATNKLDGLKAVLDAKAGPEGQSLLASPAYQAVTRTAGNAVLRAYVNLDRVKRHPVVQAGLNKGVNPLGALLFAGTLDALRQSTWLALAAKIDDRTLSLEATVDSNPSGKSPLAAFARSEKPTGGILPNLVVPHRIAAMSFYRDLHAFYAAKDRLFPERTSGLIFFENMMGIFFSGRDLTDEVLAQFRPEIRFVVAEQRFDPKVGIPQLQLPAFALVLKVVDPEEASGLLEEAFQKAVGLVSFTSGQKGVPGYVVDRPTHAGVRYTVAYAGKPHDPQQGPLPIRYNFRPTLAKIGDSVIVSSAEGLARDLIDALKQETASPPKATRATDSLVEVDAAQAASILMANHTALVRQNMMEKGVGQQQAETNIGLFLIAMKLLGRASLALGEQDGKVQARLTIEFQ